MKGELSDNVGPSIAVPLLVDECDSRPESTQFSSRGSSSFFKACFNGLNALSGVGILSIPYALSSGGWLSLVLLFLIAGCTLYTGLLIEKCMDMNPNIRTYPDIGYQAFGPKGRAFVSIAMNCELYLVATGFLILEGDNLNSLFPNMEYEISGIYLGGRHCFILIVGLILLPTVWLDNLSILSYISATGVVSSFVLIIAIFWTGAFDDDIGFHEKGEIINFKGIPTAVSLYAFCYCAHPVFPTLYASMRDQTKFTKVLLLCFLVCTTSYASMAILGYLMFGSRVQSQITLDLPTNKLSSKVAIYTTIVNPLAKYALMVTPIVNNLENILLSRPDKRLSMLIRTCLVTSSVIVALVVPFFGDLMSLVGAFFSVTASVILPCLCFMKISGNYIHTRLALELIFMWGIILFGIFVLVFGTYTALKGIFEHLVR